MPHLCFVKGDDNASNITNLFVALKKLKKINRKFYVI